jgi:low affinity Fe/Cu permease
MGGHRAAAAIAAQTAKIARNGTWAYPGVFIYAADIVAARPETKMPIIRQDSRPGGNGAPLAAQFSKFAQATASWAGHPTAFLLAATAIVVWIVTGPIFHYSDTWQLVINTGTTIVTFLMVFLIQNTQNRDTLALQLKLSELVLAMKGAENKFASIEDLSDAELEKLHEECRARAEMTAERLERRRSTHTRRQRKPRGAAHRTNHSARRYSAKS